MGLLNNCIRTQWAGIAGGSAHALLPGNWNSYRQHEKDIVPDGASAVLNARSSPTGYRNPFCHHPPLKDGELSWGTTGTGDLNLSVLMSRSLVFDFTASGDLDLSISQAAAMAFAMTGSGTLTCSLPGRASMSFDFTGTGDLEADLKGLANMVFDFVGTGDLDTILKAYGNMSFDIVVTGTGLTVENVRESVWGATAAAHNDAGTMGELLNAAGGGSSPEIIAEAVMDALAEGSIDVRAVLRRMLALASGEGVMPSGPGTFTMKSQDGTKDRIVGEIDEDGNRTITSTDDT